MSYNEIPNVYNSRYGSNNYTPDHISYTANFTYDLSTYGLNGKTTFNTTTTNAINNVTINDVNGINIVNGVASVSAEQLIEILMKNRYIAPVIVRESLIIDEEVDLRDIL